MLRLGLALAALVFAADQASKWYMDEVVRLPERGHVPLFRAGPLGFDLTMVWNRGVTFGLLSGGAWWHALALAALSLVVVAVLVAWMRRAETRGVALALGAVVGGALGNVVDRLRWGAVFDFADAHAWGWHWYVFNLADAAIVLGVAWLLGDALLRPRPEAREPA